MTNEQLVIRIRAGENVADNMLQLWQQNRGFIHKIVNQYKAYADEEDLEQEGYLGLNDAVKHYNLDEGVTFLHYAGFWIKQYIVRYIKSNGMVRIPESMQGKAREYKKMVQKWQENYHRPPTDEEIYYFLGFKWTVLENVKKAVQMTKIGSLDVPVGEDEDSTMYDLVSGGEDVEEQIMDKIEREQMHFIVWKVVDSLPDQEAAVIRAKYQGGMTVKEISESQGENIETIRQRERKGIRELRKPFRGGILRPFLFPEEEQRAYSMGLRGNGVESFNRTWTSSTERAALEL